MKNTFIEDEEEYENEDDCYATFIRIVPVVVLVLGT
jgi:hypothetical protein